MLSTMRFFFGGFLVLLVVQPATAGFVFVSDAYFVAGNEPRTSGSGLFMVEKAPIGSGIPLTAPANLTDGFATGRDFVIRYVVSAADLGGSVFINWTADRDFEALGGFATNTVNLGFTIELADSQGGSAFVLYEAGTVHKMVGGTTAALVFDTVTLSPDDTTRTVSREATGPLFTVSNSGFDSLRQNFFISLTPTRAGQEFRIYLSPDVGVISTSSPQGGVAPVPEPSSIVLGLTALPLLGLAVARWRVERRNQNGTISQA